MEIPVVQTVEREVVREVPVERIVWRDREVPVGVYMDTVHMCACIFAQAFVFVFVLLPMCARKGAVLPVLRGENTALYFPSLPCTSLHFPSRPLTSLLYV
jgi:hypothetical protein